MSAALAGFAVTSWAEAARRRDLIILKALEDAPNWFEERVAVRLVADAPTGCLLWTGSVDSAGYGRVAIPRAVEATPTQVRIHRVAYIRSHGLIPFGLTLDHLCRTRLCGDAEHLEAVTSTANTMRGLSLPAINATRTHCPYGHPLDGVTTTQRYCRTCKTKRNRKQEVLP